MQRVAEDEQPNLSLNERFEMWAVDHPFVGGPLVALAPASVAWGLAGPVLAIVVWVGFAAAIITMALRAQREDR